MADGLQDGQHPAHRAVAPTHQHPELHHLLEGVEAARRKKEGFDSQAYLLESIRGGEEGGQSPGQAPPPCHDWPAHPPGQRASVGDVKHLVGVEQLAEAVQKVATFQAAAPGVDKHQQGADVWSQLLHLHTVTTR